MNAAETLARFSHDFGVPFLRGQVCRVSDPLGSLGLAHVRHGLSVEVALKEACDLQHVEAALLCDVTPAPFDDDAATLLYAAHELFATTHPQASAFYARAHSFARAAAAAVDALPRTLDSARLVTRHLIVHRTLRARRTDVFLKWWTGQARFFGEEPPRRLTALPSLRRVEALHTTTPMWQLALQSGDDDVRAARLALLVALLDASPLTRLLLVGDPVQKRLGFSLLLPWKAGAQRASPLDLVNDPRLARLVTDTLLAGGLDQTGAALALAVLQGLRELADPALLRRGAELCTHLALTACLIEAAAPGAPEARPLVSFLQDEPTALHEAARVFWAVVSATLALGGPGSRWSIPDLSDQPASVQALHARLVARLQQRRITAVAEPLVRELSRRFPARSADGAARVPPTTTADGS